MTDGNKASGLAELIREWVFHRFGKRGLVTLFIICLIGYAFFYTVSNWEKVKTWPGVVYITRGPIPPADPNRFSVLVAHLENDAKGEHEQLIVEALKEFEGIQVLALDRTIPLAGPVPEEKEKQGHENARRYLQQSGASVLIWGMVLSRGGSTVLKLYWTPAQGGERKPERYNAPLAEGQFRLPEVFWSDLSEILRMLVVAGDSEFRTKEGHYVADRLPPFIARVRKLIEASAGRPGWNPYNRGATRLILADTLRVLGEQSGKNEPIEEAVAANRAALQDYTRERASLDWAFTQNNLGAALSSLGERESGTARLEEAVTAYREALKEFTRERVPLNWAGTQNNLGIALSSLGERQSGTARLEEAVTTYREALKEFTRERVPLDWAMTQTNLATALRRLGERDSNTGHLEEAVVACREALKEYTRERVPLRWASTQHNLATALSLWGERESGTARLEEAVTTYREALKEFTRERVPLDWALIQNDLGNALTSLGEREGSTSHIEEAVAAYKVALEVFEAHATYFVDNTKGNLQRAEALLHERRH